MESKINLGDKVIVSSYYKRVKKYLPNKTEYGTFQQRHKLWELRPLKEDTTGVVVGIRTISNGRTDYDSEVGHMYSPKEFFRALVVATSLYRKPLLTVLPSPPTEQQD